MNKTEQQNISVSERTAVLQLDLAELWIQFVTFQNNLSRQHTVVYISFEVGFAEDFA